MDQAHVRHDLAHLPALQLADEVPGEASPWRASLRLESCARFSPTSAMPASASAPSSLDGDVLDRGEQLDLAGSRPARRAAAAISARTRARFAAHALGVEPAISSATPPPPGDPSTPAVAPVGEEQRVGADRAQPDVVDLGHAGRRSRARAIALQVEVRPRARRRGREGGVHLVADLVAAAARAGPIAATIGPRAELAQRRARPPRRRPRRGRASRRAASPRRRRRASATGRQSATSTTARRRERGRLAVGGLGSGARASGGRRAAHAAPRAPGGPGRRLERDADSSASALAVGAERRRARPRSSSAEVEARVRPARDPAATRREQRPAARQVDRDVLAGDRRRRGRSLHVQLEARDRLALCVLEVRAPRGHERSVSASRGARGCRGPRRYRRRRRPRCCSIRVVAVGVVVGDPDEVLARRVDLADDLARADARLERQLVSAK